MSACKSFMPSRLKFLLLALVAFTEPLQASGLLCKEVLQNQPVNIPAIPAAEFNFGTWNLQKKISRELAGVREGKLDFHKSYQAIGEKIAKLGERAQKFIPVYVYELIEQSINLGNSAYALAGIAEKFEAHREIIFSELLKWSLASNSDAEARERAQTILLLFRNNSNQVSMNKISEVLRLVPTDRAPTAAELSALDVVLHFSIGNTKEFIQRNSSAVSLDHWHRFFFMGLQPVGVDAEHVSEFAKQLELLLDQPETRGRASVALSYIMSDDENTYRPSAEIKNKIIEAVVHNFSDTNQWLVYYSALAIEILSRRRSVLNPPAELIVNHLLQTSPQMAQASTLQLLKKWLEHSGYATETRGTSFDESLQKLVADTFVLKDPEVEALKNWFEAVVAEKKERVAAARIAKGLKVATTAVWSKASKEPYLGKVVKVIARKPILGARGNEITGKLQNGSILWGSGAVKDSTIGLLATEKDFAGNLYSFSLDDVHSIEFEGKPVYTAP